MTSPNAVNFVHIEKPPANRRNPLRSKGDETCHGSCLVDNAWTQCFPFDDDNGIIQSEDNYYEKVLETPQDQDNLEIEEAMTLVAKVSRAAGAIRITYGGLYNQLSGFYVTDNVFLTCAHSAADNTLEAKMRTQKPGVATVSTDHKPFVRNKVGKSAYLIHRDEERDFALFRLDRDQDTQKDYQSTDTFVSLNGSAFPCEVLRRRAFAIGVNGKYMQESFQSHLDEIRRNLTPERSVLYPRTGDFFGVFHPNYKSLSVGRLSSTLPIANSDSWAHFITGWHGMSGAMVACLDKSQPDARVLILGLFRAGLEGDMNQMIYFTTDLINEIKKHLPGQRGSDIGQGGDVVMQDA